MEDVLFAWEYIPSRYSKITRFLLPLLIACGYAIFSLLSRKLPPFKLFWVILLFLLIMLKLTKTTPKKYKLTKDGIYSLDDPAGKSWKRLCTWNEIMDYQRSGTVIKIRKRKFPSLVNLYFGDDPKELFTALTIINDCIHTHS